MKRCFNTAIALVLPTLAVAQAPAQPPATDTDFPPAAEVLSEEALRTRVAGKVFKLQYANGMKLRLDVRSNGYAYVDTSTGFRDTGRWQVKGSTWCDDWQRATAAPGCNEVRVADGVLLLKRRSTGEIVAMRE